MSAYRAPSSVAVAALLTALAQTPASAATHQPSPLCVPGSRVEIKSEGAWYPGVVLDQLQDGRCFVHYDNYNEDDDEAVSANELRSAR